MSHEEMLKEALLVIADQRHEIDRLMQVVYHYTSARTIVEKTRVTKRLERNGVLTRLTATRSLGKAG